MGKRIKSALAQLSAVALILSLSCALGFARVAAEEKFPSGTYGVGPFTVIFSADGKFSVSRDGESLVEGYFEVSKDQITITDKGGPMACMDVGSGKYQWKFDGKALTFTLIEDECAGRSGALTSEPLVKKAK